MRILCLFLLSLSQLTAADAGRDARWRQDLDAMATLAQLHPNLFFQLPRSTWDQAIADLRNTIPDLSDTEVMVQLARIAALPGDGHTNLFLTQRNSIFHILPVQVRWFEDGLFVTATSQANTRALGARVVQIGDRPLDEAYRLVGGIISHENDSWVRDQSPNYLVNADVLRALKIAPDAAPVRFELEDLSGARFTLDLVPLDPGQSVPGVALPAAGAGFVPFYRQQTNQNYWFTYIASSRTLYFAYNVCANQAGLPFAQFNTQLWAVFDAQPVERLVIDVRNNSGGDSSVLDAFLNSRNARASRLAAARPAVIIGRHTYSSAIINAIALEQRGAILFGEPSGGSPNSYGEVRTLVLPNSQLNVSYSTRFFSFPGYPAGALLPNFAMPVWSADWFARHDPFLAAALADVGPPPAQATQGMAIVNAANARPGAAIAPGSLASAFAGFTGVSNGDAAAIPLPKEIAGVQVLVNGAAAPLLAVRGSQINFQVPAATAPGAAAVRVLGNGGEIASGTARIALAAPGIFVADPLNPARPGAVLDENSRLVQDASPARRGSVIQIYATGQGATDLPVEDGAAGAALSALAPRVYFGGELADVLYSGLQPSFPGLWQLNVRIPESESLSGQTPVFIVMGGSVSNAVTVAVN